MQGLLMPNHLVHVLLPFIFWSGHPCSRQHTLSEDAAHRGTVTLVQALSPVGRCKTFDAGADGYGRGEGFAVLILRGQSMHADGALAWIQVSQRSRQIDGSCAQGAQHVRRCYAAAGSDYTRDTRAQPLAGLHIAP